MGTLRLLVPDEIVSNRRIMSTVHMIRFDATPWPCRVESAESVVTLHRLVQHSGQVCLSYPISDIGEVVLRTGTLPERAEPYSLPLELARGTIDRLRTQLDVWRESGLNVPPQIDSLVNECVEGLADAVLLTSEFARQTQICDRVLAQAWKAMLLLCAEFVQQLSALRKKEAVNGTWLGVRIKSQPPDVPWPTSLDPVIELLCVGADDARVIEANGGRRHLMTGPLWDARQGGLPDEINAIDQFEAKRTAAREYFFHQLQNVHPTTEWLYVASGLNGIGHKSLSYPQQMQLVVDVLQLIEQSTPHRELMISFDHPWGERLAWSVGGAPGLQIADILLRQDVRVSGLGLEINLDYWPTGSLPRDPLQWLELIDTWGQFGLPLFLFFRVPTGDLAATPGSNGPSPIRNSLLPGCQMEYLKSVLGIVLARPMVQAVIWNDWQDEPGSPFPQAGLLGVDGRLKPIGKLLVDLHANGVADRPATTR